MQNISSNPLQILLWKVTVTWGTAQFGIIEKLPIKFTPIKNGRDSKGRTIISGYDFSAEWNMMQTGEAELEAVSTSASDDDFADITFNSTIHTFTIPQVKPVFEIDLNADGKPSRIKVKVDKILTLSEFKQLFIST